MHFQFKVCMMYTVHTEITCTVNVLCTFECTYVYMYNTLLILDSLWWWCTMWFLRRTSCWDKDSSSLGSRTLSTGYHGRLDGRYVEETPLISVCALKIVCAVCTVHVCTHTHTLHPVHANVLLFVPNCHMTITWLVPLRAITGLIIAFLSTVVLMASGYACQLQFFLNTNFLINFSEFLSFYM